VKMMARVLLPVAYAGFVVAALVWMLLHERETAFAGVFAVLLTLPWSVVAIIAFSLISPGIFDASLIPGTLVVILCACLNAVILRRVGARIDTAGHAAGSV